MKIIFKKYEKTLQIFFIKNIRNLFWMLSPKSIILRAFY